MRTFGAAFLACVCAVTLSQAEGRELFRCNGSIVETGLTATEVLARCGEPDAREATTIPVRASNRRGASYVVGTATLEHWVYERRAGQFPAYLTFDEGRLRRIEFIYRR